MLNIQAIERKVRKTAQNLLESQVDLFRFTPATKQSEWNIARHFANELAPLFREYDCDTDVIKTRLGRKRPDVVIHKRGVHRHNLLVVEIKRDEKDVDGEIEKIRTAWFMPPLRYRFGAVVVINDTEPPYVTVIRNRAPRKQAGNRRLVSDVARRLRS